MDEFLQSAVRRFISGKRLSAEEKKLLTRRPGTLKQWRDLLFPRAAVNSMAPGFHPGCRFKTSAYKRAYPWAQITYFVPESYDYRTPCGLLFFMHGGDAATPFDAPWRTYLSPGGTIHDMAKKSNYIIAAPSAPPSVDGKRWNHPGATRYLLAVLDEVQSLFTIDADRRILAGYSMGGYGAYHQGQLLSDIFAGLLPGAGAWQESDFRNFNSMEIFLLHGRNDTSPAFRGVFPVARHHDWCGFSFAAAAHELMNKYGMPHTCCFHDGGHPLTGEAAAAGMAEFFRWFPGCRRNRYPEKIYLSTPAGSGNPLQEDKYSTHNCDIVRLDSGYISTDRIKLTGPNIAASEDDVKKQSYKLFPFERSGAKIEITYRGGNFFAVKSNCAVTSFRLWLSPEQIDFARPVQVEWEGCVKTFPVKPTVETLLKSFLRKKDPGMLYPAAVECHRQDFQPEHFVFKN